MRGVGEPGSGRTRRAAAVAAAACVVLVLLAATARAANFVADLSDHLIAITTAFTGTDVLLFGTVDKPGVGVAVVVRGPSGQAVVRRKSRMGLIWVYTSEVRLADAPKLLRGRGEAVRPARSGCAPSWPCTRSGSSTCASIRHRARSSTGPSSPPSAPPSSCAKQRERLYPEQAGTVSFLGDTLFRTRIVFPANVPPGDYQVQVLQFEDGEVGPRPARSRSPRWARGRSLCLAAPAGAVCCDLDRAGAGRRVGRQRFVP